MLVAQGAWSSAGASVETRLLLDAAARAHVVKRSGLVVDSRFLPGPDAPRDVCTVHLVLDGAIEVGLAGVAPAASVAGPVAHVLTEGEFERRDAAAPWFRLSGSPAIVIDVCIERARVVRAGLVHGPASLSASTWRAARGVAEAGSDDESAAAFSLLLDGLCSDGVLLPTPTSTPSTDEPESLRRLWAALSRFYARQDTSVFLGALVAFSGLSLRQLGRDIDELDRRFRLHGGFRATVRLMRVRRAVLLLSLPTLSVADVADVVGYGSAQAMERAFRDCALPPPTSIRRSLLSP